MRKHLEGTKHRLPGILLFSVAEEALQVIHTIKQRVLTTQQNANRGFQKGMFFPELPPHLSPWKALCLLQKHIFTLLARFLQL